ncbi:MAG TPA: pilus assembly protein PilP [Gammaproteobacteria bacterium]|nr:pilus assembly protein PilP [Gammaproteobacteria bacterium]
MRLIGIFVLIFISAILSGCAPQVDEDVVEFIKETKEKKSKYVSKIPKIPETTSFQYKAFAFRDPFVPYSTPSAKTSVSSSPGGPDLNRPREALEAFPLDSLQMVGTIERDGIFFVLLKNTAGNVYRASVGNYVGQNSGKIEKINATEIAIKEWLSNGKSGWREHVLTIPLRSKSSVTKGA